ncbi:MAG: hypothetical protein ACI841_001588 [Planctomycetota bacterium]|jgi:hypothetical protein
MECPPLADLLNHAASGLIPQEWQTHVEDDCSRCQARWRVGRMLSSKSQQFAQGPPAHLLQAALELSSPGQGLDRIRAFVAKLLPAPALRPALRGIGQLCQKLYEAGDSYEVDLTHLDSGDLIGQLSPLDGYDFECVGTALLQNGNDTQFATLDEGGEFQFEGISPGRYDLLLALSNERILVEAIELD